MFSLSHSCYDEITQNSAVAWMVSVVAYLYQLSFALGYQLPINAIAKIPEHFVLFLMEVL